MRASHCIMTWSRTLSVLALSTGEAELMAVVRGTCEAFGIRALMQYLGYHVDLQLLSDATAAIGMVSRLGLGRVRHLAVSDLWIQQAARRGEITYKKIPGSHNPSDLLTKYLAEAVMNGHLERLHVFTCAGRPACAATKRVAPAET